MARDFTSSLFPCVDTFEEDPSVIYTLDDELRITYCNKAWDRFAEENAGKGLARHLQTGRRLLECIPDPLAEFYRGALAGVLRTGAKWEHRFECSSAEQYRCFHMQVLPFQPVGLLVINSKTEERPHAADRAAHPPLRELYSTERGVIRMCSHCRRTFRAGTLNTWDWVPEYVRLTPAAVTHGLCDPCLTYHYSLATPGRAM